MLNQLLRTLKSQKSSKPTHPPSQPEKQNPYHIPHNQIYQYKIAQPIVNDQHTLVKGPLAKIRYFVLANLPTFLNQVIGCPISVFHILPHSQRKVKEIDLAKDAYPEYLQFLKPMLEHELPTYNHMLINDYPPGIGIMPHGDGPAYLAKVLVLSLNGYAIISFQKSYNSGQEQGVYCSRILLQPNSVHIFEQQAYSQYLHGIENYLIDSILINYNYETKTVDKATVDNYNLLACRKTIEEQIQKQVTDTQLGDIRVLKLQNNHQFTHKIQITRQQRISITIRQKYHSI